MISFFKKILFWILLLFLCALALEILTAVGFKNIPKEAFIPHIICTYDPDLGWANRPNIRASSSRTGQWIEYEINSKGLRGQETSYQKPKNLFRIVLLGDSHAFGFGVPIEKHFSTLLKKYFKNVEVVNLGVQAFGVDQMYLYLLKEGFKYQPDLVLMYLPGYYKDFRHMYSKRYGRLKPEFDLINGRLRLTNCPVPRDYFLTDNEIFAKIDSCLDHYSCFYRSLCHLIRINSKAYKNNEVKDNKIPSNKLIYELGEKIIFKASDECRKRQIKFLLVTGSKELSQGSEKQNIQTLITWPALNNGRFQSSGNSWHLNENGNGLLSWIIADYLEKNAIVPAKYWQ